MDAKERTLERVKSLIKKGEQVLDDGERSKFDSFKIVKWGPSVGWHSQTQAFLEDLLGADHAYTRTFAEGSKDPSSGRYVEAGLEILDSFKQDIEHGYLRTYRQLIEADLLGGLMGQSEYLLERSYLLAAAAVAGAALQQGLEELAKRHGLKLSKRENLDSLADKLLQAEVIDGLERRQLSLYAGVRNSADHGKTAELSKENVGTMVSGAVDFLTRHGSAP